MEWREVRTVKSANAGRGAIAEKPAYVFSDGNNNKMTFSFTKNSKVWKQNDVPFLYVSHRNLHSIRFENKTLFKGHYVIITAKDWQENRKMQGKTTRGMSNRAPKTATWNILNAFNKTVERAWSIDALENIKFSPEHKMHESNLKSSLKEVIRTLREELMNRIHKIKVMHERR